MNHDRPYALSIAGFDPSSGAGVLADIKTFELHRTLGFGVCTSVTYQHDGEFDGVSWLSFENIRRQIESLFQKYTIRFVKIGLIENFETLSGILDLLRRYNNEIKIIWDPVLEASAGYIFHRNINPVGVDAICKKIYLITPNWREAETIWGKSDLRGNLASISRFCNVLLKGGHNHSEPGTDYLFTNGDARAFAPVRVSAYGKHGSGCVLSSAITANLALGFDLAEAVLRSKEYIADFLDSNPGGLGYHYE